MSEENTLANDVATDATENDSQAKKTYTQEEFDAAMAKTRTATLKKALKPYEDLGDVDELRNLRQQFEAKQLEDQKKRGEFDNILKDIASKKDAEIQRRDQIIAEYKVDIPLTNAAAKHRSVNPEQVKALLKGSLRLNGEGEVEVIDNKGTVRYKDSGDAYQVEDLVREFLDSNPHFVQPTPSTTQTRNSISPQGGGALDLSKLDMKNPEHRKLYAEHQARK
jgi:hypothetical protein